MNPNPSEDVVATYTRVILASLGQDVDSDALRDTPRRVAESLRELTEGYGQDPREILNRTFDVPHDEMVVVRGIEFWSLCEHHLLPFHGHATIGYLPQDKIVGLSKLGRVVQVFARRLQVQERMTDEIAHAIEDVLEPIGVGVVVTAQHTCMAMRGARLGADMVTSCLLGKFRSDPTVRAEFLALAK